MQHRILPGRGKGGRRRTEASGKAVALRRQLFERRPQAIEPVDQILHRHLRGVTPLDHPGEAHHPAIRQQSRRRLALPRSLKHHQLHNRLPKAGWKIIGFGAWQPSHFSRLTRREAWADRALLPTGGLSDGNSPHGAANRRRGHRGRRQDARRQGLCPDLSGLARLQCHGGARPGSDDPRFCALQPPLWPGRAASVEIDAEPRPSRDHDARRQQIRRRRQAAGRNLPPRRRGLAHRRRL